MGIAYRLCFSDHLVWSFILFSVPETFYLIVELMFKLFRSYYRMDWGFIFQNWAALLLGPSKVTILYMSQLLILSNSCGHCSMVIWYYNWQFVHLKSVHSCFVVVVNFYLFIFDWRIIVLQYCLGFCHTATWYIYPLPVEPPPLTQPTLRSSQSTGLNFLSYTATSH